ncbi:hypothetical protein Btru_040991 [Bulinus truncatus]|nr:hypothetical protein Btru_040991 [Bulinus truncatus]
MGQITSNLFQRKDFFYGHHEVDEFVGEAESSTLPKCSKDHGHKDMIPRSHIPEPYQDAEEVYKLVKAMAYLTVRLKTNYVSKKRPRYLPRTNYDYPLYEKRGEKGYNSGTGRVCDVVKMEKGQCSCKKCQDPKNSPSTTWWSVKIFTATHVVYDDNEAAQTTCNLFYDGGVQKEGREKTDLVGCKKIWLDVGGDLCLIETPTCDQNLATKLFDKIKKFNTYWQSLQTMYELDRQQEKLVMIVSHPHGSEKRISVGLGVDIGRKKKLGYSKFIYTAPTCPGTSGGPVYILGFDWFKTEYVHGGTVLGTISDSDSSSDSEERLTQEDLSEHFPSFDRSSVLPLSYSSIYMTDDHSMESNRVEDISDRNKTSNAPSSIHTDTPMPNANIRLDLVGVEALDNRKPNESISGASPDSGVQTDNFLTENSSTDNQPAASSNVSENLSKTRTSANSASKLGKYAKYPNYSARWY